MEAALRCLAPISGSLVSLTGGEPLLQLDAAIELADLVRDLEASVYLETHGLAVEALERIVDRVDVVAMDWKLASDVRPVKRTGALVQGFDDRHEAFVSLARQRACDVFVKVVITPNTRVEELQEVCRRLARSAPDVILVLQPVTPVGDVRSTPSAAELLEHLRRCERTHRDVRLIPQTHKVYGAL